jgi:ABC-type uncharacterized transport system
MATAADTNNSQAPQAALFTTATATFVGLAWGAVMLFVFGFWMRSKYEGGRPIVTYTFLIAGVAAAALAIWQAFTTWIQKETPEQKSASLEKQRRIFSYVFLAAGLGLIILAFVLGIDKKTGDSYGFKLENFAEAFGALLFGLIALCGGYVLQQPLTSNASPIHFLVGKIPVIKMILIVLGVASLGTLGFIFFKQRSEFAAYFPELAALLFMSMLCLGCLLWLNTGQFDEFGIRLFVLVFGGATGLILFLMILCRAYLWRQDILLGGSAAWQGDNAYRFWLCAYVLFAALVLMFVSFNLARADIRTHVALRRVMYGYDALVQGMLLIGIMAILNIVIYALVPFSYDWTKSRGAYALADNNKNLIAGLKQETNIIVLVPQGSHVYKDLRNLMDNCQAIGNRFKVQYLSPDLNQREYADLVKLFPTIYPEIAVAPREVVGRGVLIVYGEIPRDEKHTTPHSFVPERKLYEVDQRAMQRGEKVKYFFKGETEILKELAFLVEAKKKRKLYILQGNDEPDINTEAGIAQRVDLRRGFTGIGMGILVDRFSSENYEVSGLSFNLENPLQKNPPNIVFAKETGADKKKNVPDDCNTLIVAGVFRPLPKQALDAIETYMERGGKMLVYLDVFADDTWSALVNSGMETLLRRYGVDVTNDFPLRVVQNPRDDPEAIFATPPKSSEHPLASQFAGKTIIMTNTARIVRPADAPGRFKAETILQIEAPVPGRPIVVEKDVSALKDSVAFMIDLIKNPEAKLFPKVVREPVPVAVAVTENVGDAKRPRLVVFGDTEFITNLEFARSKSKQTNYAFTVSAIEWMAGGERIGAPPNEHTQFTLDPGVDYWRMILLPAWLMLLTLIGLGISIWIVRRR